MSGEEIAERPLSGEVPRDGIGEEDNPIPIWFHVGFWGLIVFGLGYIFFYGAMAPFSQGERWRAEVEAAEAQYAAARAGMPKTNPYRGDAAAVAEGAKVFETICVACHLPDGSGLVGPSLVDPYWKYGQNDEALFTTVSEGRPLGMPAWAAQLGTDKIWKVLAYIETLPKSDEPGVGSPEFEAAKAAAAGGTAAGGP